MSQKTSIAFFGLGTMGIGMARRLLGAPGGGFPLAVYNRNPDKAAPLAAQGARIAQSPREAAKDADILIAMLSDDDASRAVWLGENGALSAVKPGAICIDCSTLTVTWVRQLAAAATAKNARFLDAPVTGTKPHAASGELTFLVGGDPATLDQVRPILTPMSKEIVHLGPTGSGAAFKLVNNFLCGVHAAALAEALALINRMGLDATKSLNLLAGGAPGSPVSKALTQRYLAADPTVYFQAGLLAKDLRYAASEARATGLTLQTAAAALLRLDQALTSGLAEKDMSSLLKFMEKSNES
jgi:3-hydroxyisobutyrate dehydrogenase